MHSDALTTTTIPAMAREFGQTYARVRWVVEDRLGILPLGRVGNTRVFSPEIRPLVRRELEAARAHRRRPRRQTMALAEA